MGKFYSAAEIAKVLGYNREYIARLIKAGKIPGTKFGHKWLVAQEDFEALVRKLHPKGKVTEGR